MDVEVLEVETNFGGRGGGISNCVMGGNEDIVVGSANSVGRGVGVLINS